MSNNYSIQSDQIKVTISDLGAELTSVKSNNDGYEFMWNADPLIWNRHAPVLFPIVGKLNNNTIKINDSPYQMNQHGFARDLVFEPIEIYTDLLKFMLEYNDVSLTKYPYQFRLFITYQVIGTSLKITYSILNLGEDKMYFSIGAHPGFKLPSPQINQYYIEFEKPESLNRYLLKDGLFNLETENLGSNQTILKLSNEHFLKDAIVLKNLNSTWLKLVQTDKKFAIKLSFADFPYMGIWTKAGQESFLCLEPWLGLADQIGFEEDISEKEGIQFLEANELKSYNYTLEFTAG